VWRDRIGPGDPSDETGALLVLYVVTGVADVSTMINTDSRPVDITGSDGYVEGYPARHVSRASVVWSPAPNTVLSLLAYRLTISEQDLLRAARSVRPDPGGFTVPIRLGTLPSGWASDKFSVSGAAPDTWRAAIDVRRRTGSPRKGAGAEADLSVAVGTVTEAPPGGDSLTVSGHPARHVVPAPLMVAGGLPGVEKPAANQPTYLVVDLGNGRLLTLIEHGGLTRDDLRAIAEDVEITPGDLNWIGG
jgi:hypothetical protein